MNQESIKNRLDELITNGYNIEIGNSINEGWELFKKNMGGYIAYTVIFALIIFTVSLIPLLGAIGNILISAPLAVGFYLVARKITKNESYEFGSFFDGFKFFGPLVLASLIMGIFIGIGFVLLIIPGIYLAVSYVLTYQFVIFGNYEFWDAMEASRKLITKNWFAFFGLMIVLGLINLLGVIALGIGVLFTIPLSYCTLYIVFTKLFDQEVE
jgi:uncharacterized membrane protein